MFSSRTPGDGELSPNPLAAAWAARRAGAGAGAAIDLTESNPTRIGLTYPEEALAAALARGASRAEYAPDPRGLLEARRAISDYLRRSRGIEVDPGSLVLFAGTSEAYGALLKMLCDPGDEVLFPAPSYPLLPHLAQLEGVEARSYRVERGYELSRVEEALGARSRAVVLVSPNNPTGSIAGPEFVAALGELAAARGVALIGDEVFGEYAFEERGRFGSVVNAGAGSALRFSLGGISKSLCLPQLKLSWVAVAGPGPVRQQALERLEFIADAYLSVATPVQRALAALFELAAPLREQLSHRLRENWRRVSDWSA